MVMQYEYKAWPVSGIGDLAGSGWVGWGGERALKVLRNVNFILLAMGDVDKPQVDDRMKLERSTWLHKGELESRTWRQKQEDSHGGCCNNPS